MYHEVSQQTNQLFSSAGGKAVLCVCSELKADRDRRCGSEFITSPNGTKLKEIADVLTVVFKIQKK
jgi:hypothetical protein